MMTTDEAKKRQPKADVPPGHYGHAPTIDIHTHIIPEHLPDWAARFGYGSFIRLEHQLGSCPSCAHMMQGDTLFRRINANCWDDHERISDCDRDGVRMQVLSTIPVMFHYWARPQDALDTSRYLNDHIAQTVGRHPHRFVGLGTVPLQDPQLAIQEMERCVKELGLAGIEIGSHVNEWNLSEPELLPFFEEAERIGAALFVHPWEMMGHDKMRRYWLPWLVGMPAETSLAICSMLFAGVFEKFPRLRVAFAHGGGSFPATFGRIERGFEVRPDLVAIDNPTSPRHYLGRFWLDSLVHDPEMLDYIARLIGHNKICVGSDYPFPLGESIPGGIVGEMHWTDAEKHQVRWKSALEWLNLPDPLRTKFGSNK